MILMTIQGQTPPPNTEKSFSIDLLQRACAAVVRAREGQCIAAIHHCYCDRTLFFKKKKITENIYTGVIADGI